MAKRKKRPLGFQTPSMRIKEEYEEILKQIKAKKTDWEKAFKQLKNTHKLAEDRLEDTFKVVETRTEKTPKELLLADVMNLTYGGLQLEQKLTQIMIAGIGTELAECDARIAALEKELKDLRKGLK